MFPSRGAVVRLIFRFCLHKPTAEELERDSGDRDGESEYPAPVTRFSWDAKRVGSVEVPPSRLRHLLFFQWTLHTCSCFPRVRTPVLQSAFDGQGRVKAEIPKAQFPVSDHIRPEK